MGTFIEFPRPDGASTRGYLADAGKGRPGVIVIQEWWGLSDHICTIADRFAAAGFSALAPDLYRGRLASDSDEASHMMAGLDFHDATHQDLHGAVTYLHERCAKIGVTGFCMGGALTIGAAVRLPGLAAAVCFYGIPPAEFADPAAIAIPFQAHFAARDDWCTPRLVDGLEAAMRQAGAAPEIFRYEADHAFFNATRAEVYDDASARLAWERTIAFLGRHLSA